MNILSHAHAGAALMAGAVRSRRPNARLSRPAPEAGDTRLVRELTAAGYDGVLIGGFISGRDREDPPAERRALWFSRVLNSVLVARRPRCSRSPPHCSWPDPEPHARSYAMQTLIHAIAVVSVLAAFGPEPESPGPDGVRHPEPTEQFAEKVRRKHELVHACGPRAAARGRSPDA